MTPDEISVAIAELRHDIKTIFKRIDEQIKVSNAVQELATSVKVMATRMEQMGKEQERMREDIEEIKARPGNRWDKVVGGVLIAAITAVVTYFITKIGG